MAFCSNCGTELPANARFCHACGISAASATSQPPPHASVAPPRQPGGPPPQAAYPAARRKPGGAILPVMVVAVALILGIVLWSQRDGTRPISSIDRDPAATSIAKAKTARDAEKAETDEEADTDAEAGADVTADTAPTRAAPRTTSFDRSGAPVTAALLDTAFINDPAGARSRFPGPVTVSGVVSSINPEGGAPSLALEGRTYLNTVVAFFDDRSALLNIVKGGRVTLSCSRAAAFGGMTTIQHCTLI